MLFIRVLEYFLLVKFHINICINYKLLHIGHGMTPQIIRSLSDMFSL